MDSPECGGERFVDPHADVALDVVHVDDRVVHHEAEAQDQRKERHAVHRVAGQMIDEQGQREAHRHGEADHQAFAPPHGDADHDRDRQDREEHAVEEVVDLFPGGLAVVAGDAHLDIRRHDRAAQRLGLFHHLACHGDGVGPFLLGERKGHSRASLAGEGFAAVFGRAKTDVMIVLRFLRTVADRGHVADRDGAAVGAAHDRVAHCRGRIERRPGPQGQDAAIRQHGARVASRFAPLEGLLEVGQADPAAGERLQVRLDRNLARQAAEELAARKIVEPIEAGLGLLGNAPQFIGIALAGVERECDHRHVVDLRRLDHPAGDSRRRDVAVALDLVAQFDDRRFAVLAHIKADGHNRLVAAADGVNMFDARHLPQEAFERPRDLLLHLGRRASRVLHEDVGHGDDDLRLLLLRRDQQGDDADDGGSGQEQERVRAGQKGARNPHGPALRFVGAVFAFVAHRSIRARVAFTIGVPSAMVGAGVVVAMTRARAGFFELLQVSGLELTHGVGNGAAGGAIDLDSGGAQAEQRAHADATDDDGFRPEAREGLDGAARAVNMLLVAIADRFDGKRFAVNDGKCGRRPEVPVYRTFQREVLGNGNGDFHALFFLLTITCPPSSRSALP